MNANAHLLTNPRAKGAARKPSRTKTLRLEWQEAQAATALAQVRFTTAMTLAEMVSTGIHDAVQAAGTELGRLYDARRREADAQQAYVDHLRTVMARADDPRKVRDVRP